MSGHYHGSPVIADYQTVEEDCFYTSQSCDVLQALGLATVRHFSQLLPLLLEWLAATDAETRLLAAQVLIASPCPLLPSRNLLRGVCAALQACCTTDAFAIHACTTMLTPMMGTSAARQPGSTSACPLSI